MEKHEEFKKLMDQMVGNACAKIDDMNGVDAFIKEYNLSSKEESAWRSLSLRIPEKTTVDKLSGFTTLHHPF